MSSVKEILFTKQMPTEITSISLNTNLNLFVACDTTNISSFDLADGKESKFETRGDSVVNALCVGECFPGNADLVAGDSEGNLIMVIDSKQVFDTKKLLPSSVTKIIYTENRGYPEIVAGDQDGILVGVDMFLDVSWRCNLALLTDAEAPSPIKCLASAWLLDADKRPSFFILATDSRPLIHFLFKGVSIISIEVPCIIAHGRVLKRNDAPISFSFENPEFCQLVFAGDDGMVYVLDHYEVYHYADVGFYIEMIAVCRPASFKTADSDLVLVGGHFIGCLVYKNSSILFKIDCDDWVFEISVWKNYIALATMDQEVKVLCI